MSDSVIPNHTATVVNTGNVGALAMPGATAISINTIQQFFTGFAPEMLHKPIETILEQFRQGNKEVAKAQLNLIREIGNQDSKVLAALDVVSIYLNLLDTGESTKARQHLTNFF